jgi:hypothetical protein
MLNTRVAPSDRTDLRREACGCGKSHSCVQLSDAVATQLDMRNMGPLKKLALWLIDSMSCTYDFTQYLLI